ncbi:MAG TPA: hypothetical protein PKD55_26220, partial [Bellilinea sp.]|nr:hypothetical protein [Bellilinea sp.]
SLSAVGMQNLSMLHLSGDLWAIEQGVEQAILRSNFIGTPTMILRKEVFAKVGGFDRALQTPVDLEFCWRAAALGARYAFINKPLIERHVHSDTLTAQGDRPWLERLKAVDTMYQICHKLGRRDLLKSVRATELRTCRNLLRIYGERAQRNQALQIYGGSLRRGISLPTLAWLLVALIGPSALSRIVKK